MHSAARHFARIPARSRVLAVLTLFLPLSLSALAQQPASAAATPDQKPAESSATAAAQQPQAQPTSVDLIKPEGIRAGTTSGGYVHASIIALAINDPKLLASRIEKSGDDYVIHFADGKWTQRVTAAEVEAIRKSGIDRSDDPWVAALFRGYEMRVLWDVMHFSIGHLNFSPNIRVKAGAMLDQSGWLVKAYERAIRATITPTGDLDSDSLRLAVREELKPIKENEDAKKSAENMLLSIVMFEDTAKAVKENGELFGAYKAVGNTMLPDHFIDALTGKSKGLDKPTIRVATAALKNLRDAKHAGVVSTANLPLAKLKSRPAGAFPWYAPLHAYTIVDSTATTVTLRNPAADDAKATFKVPAAAIAPLFTHITVEE